MTRSDDLAMLVSLVARVAPEDLADVIGTLDPEVATALVAEIDAEQRRPYLESPLTLADVLFEGRFRDRPQLRLLADVMAEALADVEAGHDRRVIVEMPPRTGKTTITTLVTPTWIMAQHPEWPIALTSHDGALATSWGRQIRRWVDGRMLPGVDIAPDAGAASAWETTVGGRMLSISVRESFTGRGAKILVIDDPHKDFVDAHSATMRQNVWDWWTSVALPRLEPPTLVVVTMTRWHQDDFVGRLLSTEFPGDPADWQVIRLPAVAEADDLLGREVGEPLVSALLDETVDQAAARWESVKTQVGTYIWNALYQQRPSPAQGAIFSTDWWRYWTSNPNHADDDRVVYLDPSTIVGGRWVDSWDCAFKATTDSDWVVGQRWVRSGPNRYLVAQQRGRWSFTKTLDRMRGWVGFGPFGRMVHKRLVEEKANGAAIIDVMKEDVSGLIPINPVIGKEGRARAITPECQSGHVYFPYPGDTGNEWVTLDLLPELRDFPHGANDDQVDAMTQALSDLRDEGSASVTVPGSNHPPIDRNIAAAARSSRRQIRPPSSAPIRRIPGR